MNSVKFQYTKSTYTNKSYFYTQKTHYPNNKLNNPCNNSNRDFPGGTGGKNLPANTRDMGSSPGPGRSHMPQSN